MAIFSVEVPHQDLPKKPKDPVAQDGTLIND
jgi:hypothetical protein